MKQITMIAAALIILMSCTKKQTATPVKPTTPTVVSGSKFVGTWNITLTCRAIIQDPGSPSGNVDYILQPPHTTTTAIIYDNGNGSINISNLLNGSVSGSLISTTQFYFPNPVIPGSWIGGNYYDIPIVGSYNNMLFTTLATISANGDTITASNSGSENYCSQYPYFILNTYYFTVKMIKQ